MAVIAAFEGRRCRFGCAGQQVCGVRTSCYVLSTSSGWPWRQSLTSQPILLPSRLAMSDARTSVYRGTTETGPVKPRSTAKERVLGTVELLEQILLSMPLDLLLQSRGVSRLWRELISRSQRYKCIQSEPYIGISLSSPTECSIADGDITRAGRDRNVVFR
jgi:hypothetical protein